MTRYALANHVFVCLQDEHVVFLDVRNDRYFSLEAARTSGLGELVCGWPVGAPAALANADAAAASQLAAQLSDKGLLTSELCVGKQATPAGCDPPVEEIYTDAWDESPSIDFRKSSEFLAAALFATFTLRFVSFERMIRQAKQSAARMPADARTRFDRDQVRDLVATFVTLRPYFFTARDACLFEALTLGRFLRRFGFDSRWVFGVQARPFAAHCWLQREGIVINDTVEHVSRYKPIMVV